MLKNIIFDLDDTLLDFSRIEREAVYKILEKNGVKSINAAFIEYQKINAKIWEKIEQGGNLAELLNQRFEKTLSLYNIKADGGLLEAEYRTYIDNSYYLLPGAKELLEKLKSLNYQLFIASNGRSKTQYARLKGTNIFDYFSAIYISEDIGFSKPDPQFFHYLFQNNNQIEATNSIMIGDRLSSDILGANDVKMKSIWYNPKKLDLNSQIKPTFIANDFDDIFNIIKRMDH